MIIFLLFIGLNWQLHCVSSSKGTPKWDKKLLNYIQAMLNIIPCGMNATSAINCSSPSQS